jgi:hypothetical protein
MNTIDPRVLYIILVIPGLFGFTLLGEGITKISNEEQKGTILILFGLFFIGVAVGAYLFFAASPVFTI